MKQVLMVDDDPLILRIYGKGLSNHGLQVHMAADGLEAVKALRTSKPDVVVLDLMMPRLSGTDVLKFMREQPDLQAVPVVVLTNAFLDEVSRQAAAAGARRVLVKIRCSPSLLFETIQQVLEGRPEAEEEEVKPAPRRIVRAPEPPPEPEPPPLSPEEAARRDAELRAQAREDFLTNAAATCSNLHELFEDFRTAKDDDRQLRLHALYRKVHFVTASAGLAECHRIAQMASAFEALLFQMMEGPSRITPSVLRTADAAIDFFEFLFGHARRPEPDAPIKGNVLVLDHDPVSSRLMVAALRNAQLQARSTDKPNVAIKWLQEQTFDLLLVDTEIPGISGFELGKRIRTLPRSEQTPIIYLTNRQDFETCVKSLISGGEDLILKPVLAMELAVKAMMHLMRRQIEG